MPMRSSTYALATLLACACPLPAQLVGGYTINPTLPASPTNYTSLTAAVTDLNAVGVAGPVFLDVYDDAGPYTESFPFATSNVTWTPSTAGLMFGQWAGVSGTNRVTFRAPPGEAPVIDASANGFGVYWNGADYVTLQGFEIRNAPFDGITLYSEASVGQVIDAVIDRCRIHHCGASGVCIYGNSANPVNTVVQNCFLYHLQMTNAGGFSTTARFGYVTTRRAQGTRILNNTFYLDTGAGGSFCAIGSNTSGATEVTYAEVTNNAFLKVAAAGRPLFRYQSTSTAIAPLPPLQDSNCFWDTTASPFALYGTSAGTTANTLADWQLATALDGGSLYMDPLLIDPANGDLHIGPGSPCFFGATVATTLTEDIDRQDRTGFMDIGADRFSAASIASVGTGCAGSGTAPVLYAREWPFLGNLDFTVLTRDAAPVGTFQLGFISFGVGPVPFPLGAGCSAYLDLATVTTLPGLTTVGPAGTSSRTLALPDNPVLVGVNVALQELVVDTGAPLGFTVTNALDIVVAY